MKLSTGLADVRGAASLCIKCTACVYSATSWPENHTLCPIYSRDNCFAYSGGGLLYLVKAVVDKQISLSQNIAELALSCTSCGACKCGIIRSHSPNANPLEIIRLLRYEGAKQGFIPAGKAKQIYEESRNNADYGRPVSLKLPEKVHKPDADTVVFAECFHTKGHERTFDAASRLLTKLERPVAFFTEQGCCGSTLYDLGFWEKLEPLVASHWQQMKVSDKKEFIFLNPHCQEFVVKRYPEILSEKKRIRHRHFSQVLADAFKKGLLKSKKGIKVKVSYHDPCYLGRELGIYDAPREVLSSLKGVSLVEMTRSRQNSYCCGAKGTGNYFSNMAGETARERLDEFRSTGADLLITACSYCQESFRPGLPDSEKDRVKDLFELVDERTG